jgi:NAD(P)-dependent dehydrogenase (short-subunit alcohol dehydrogenase family)
MVPNWTDQIVIVTGGGGGMGQAAAKRFAEAGAKTFVFGRTLESLQECASLSPNIVPVVCDVADAASIGSAMEVVLKHGAPNVLIHTAGINTPDRFMAHGDPGRIASLETWQKVMDINVLGVVNMIQAVAKPMAANGGGKIVVVSSTAGHGLTLMRVCRTRRASGRCMVCFSRLGPNSMRMGLCFLSTLPGRRIRRSWTSVRCCRIRSIARR